MDVINNIKLAFLNLKNKNCFFVSEADFQHCFAMELERVFNGMATVLLEFPIEQHGRIIYIDIMLVHGQSLYPIELKYKTKIIPSEKLYGLTGLPIKKILKDHNAVDINGYNFWKDINRIEQLVENNQVVAGVCIMITNDRFYWSGKWRSNSKGFPFRTLQGKYRCGTFKWQHDNLDNIPKWIMQHPGFEIKNDYEFQWCDFCDTGDKNGIFKSLFIEIPQNTGSINVK